MIIGMIRKGGMILLETLIELKILNSNFFSLELEEQFSVEQLEPTV